MDGAVCSCSAFGGVYDRIRSHHVLDVCGEKGSERDVPDKSDSAFLGRGEVLD